MKHEESKDIQALCRLKLITPTSMANQQITAPKDALIGIKTWGRIDYLTNRCGWRFIWTEPKNIQSPNIKKNNKRKKKNIYEPEDD